MMRTTKHLVFAMLALCLGQESSIAQKPASATPEQVAAAYYRICGTNPLDLDAINALRTNRTQRADPNITRAALTGIGGNGRLTALRFLDSQINGDTATLIVLLRYQDLPPRKMQLRLVRENSSWKVDL